MKQSEAYCSTGVLFAAQRLAQRDACHSKNRLLFIERTGHTYQQKHQEVADKILQLSRDWQELAKQQIAHGVSSVCDFMLI